MNSGSNNHKPGITNNLTKSVLRNNIGLIRFGDKHDQSELIIVNSLQSHVTACSTLTTAKTKLILHSVDKP